jgi:hypothetical protein
MELGPSTLSATNSAHVSFLRSGAPVPFEGALIHHDVDSETLFPRPFHRRQRFTSPTDFNTQLHDWLTRANTRTVRAIGGRPVDLLAADVAAMIELPPVIPAIGLTHRIR